MSRSRQAATYISDAIWAKYQEHGDLKVLREEILTDPWYEAPQWSDDSLLMRAVEASDLSAVQMLLAMGFNPNLPAWGGFSFLHQAVDEIASVGFGAPRHVFDFSQKTAIAISVLKALLEGGADPNVLGQDGTPLHRAAGWGEIQAAEILLSHGAKLEARMIVDGELTPLMHAAMSGHPKMVRFLLDRGADRVAISGPSLTHPPLTLKQLLAKFRRNGPHTKEILAMLEAP